MSNSELTMAEIKPCWVVRVVGPEGRDTASASRAFPNLSRAQGYARKLKDSWDMEGVNGDLAIVICKAEYSIIEIL